MSASRDWSRQGPDGVAAIRATNRTQRLVLGFFVLALAALVGILVTSPEIYDSILKVEPGFRPLADLAFLVAISTFLVVLGVGVLRRWRWLFWVILVAFLFGVVRVPAAALQLMGILPSGGPTWYVVLQAMTGVVQFLIALAMLTGYRRAGVWGGR